MADTVMLAAADGAVVYRVPNPDARAKPELDISNAHQRFGALGLVIGDQGSTVIAAFDVRALRKRWATPLWSPPELAHREAEVRQEEGDSATKGSLVLADVVACKGTLVAEVAWAGQNGSPRTDLVGIDASRGSVLWRRSMRYDHVLCANGRVHTERHTELSSLTLETLDASSGKTLWSFVDEGSEIGGPAPTASEDILVTWRAPHGAGIPIVTTWDAATGKPSAHRPAPAALEHAEVASMQLSHRDLVLVASDKSGCFVADVDVTQGTLRWQSPKVPPTLTAASPFIGFDDDVVFACTANTLRGFERTGGALLWAYGVGGCGGVTMTRPDPNAPAWILSAQYSLDAANPHFVGTMTAFGRGDRVVPTERAVVEGQARPGAPVRVGDSLVKADAKGHYRATVEPW